MNLPIARAGYIRRTRSRWPRIRGEERRGDHIRPSLQICTRLLFILILADAMAAKDWSLTSWRRFPVKQQPSYPDTGALDAAVDRGQFLHAS
jgi:hypothetical protein